MIFTIYDSTFKAVAIVDEYISAIWTDRYNKPGDFQVIVALSSSVAKTVRTGHYIRASTSDSVMVVETLDTSSDINAVPSMRIVGRDILSLLDRRIVWTQTTIDGSLHSGVRKIINENVISPSISSRKIPQIKFLNSSDPKVTGLQAEAQYTGDPVLEAVIKLCESGDLGLRMLCPSNSVEDGSFEFEIYAGKDRSYAQTTNPWVIYSPDFENLLSSGTYISTELLKNVSLVGGEGEGSDRKFVVAGKSSASGLSRREMFTDAREITSKVGTTTISASKYRAQLKQKGKKDLAARVKISTFDGEADSTVVYQYGRDFGMGDLVQLENDLGEMATVRIVEYIQTSSVESGFVAYPSFSSLEEVEEDD